MRTIIDCDVHPYPRNKEVIQSYLAQPWRDRFQGAGRGHYSNPVHGERLDSRPPGGGPGERTPII